VKILRVVAAAAAALVLLVFVVSLYFEHVANPRVERELVENPQSERAQRVMLLTLPSGRRLPVNYLRQGDRVYAASDGTWWQELHGQGFPVALLVQGETLEGMARAVRDDPEYTQRIFAELRPDAVEGFGTLIEIVLEAPDSVSGGPGGLDVE